MANIVYGGVVLKARGSIAGVTYSRCAHSETARLKPHPILRTTSAHSITRRRMQYWVPYWRTLSPTDQDDWTTYGATVILTNSLNNTYKLTGQQAFLRSMLFHDDDSGSFPTVRPTGDGQSSIPTIVLDIDGADLRVATITPGMAYFETMFASVWAPQHRTKHSPRGVVLTRTFWSGAAPPPHVLWPDYTTRLPSGSYGIAYVDFRFIDADFRPCSMLRIPLEFQTP